MADPTIYQPTTWVDNTTPLSAANLNNLETQYEDAVQLMQANYAVTHAGALTALYNFNGTTMSTRGQRGQFSRASAANNPQTLASLPNDAPSYVWSKWGAEALALSLWEGTTNLVYNSDFETVTTTAQLFSDSLTSGAAWTVQAGSFTYSASGATSGAGGSIITAGNIAWKPLLGSDGSTSLPLTAQATFTQPPTVGLQHLGLEQSFSGGETGYRIEITGGTMYLSKVSAGTPTNLSTVAETLSASTTYTMTLSLDHLGNLTAKLYSGAGTGGTLLQTLTATDTSLSGGFLLGVGGDTGVVVSNASVTGAWANGWSIGGNGNSAYALTENSINGTYSLSMVTVSGGNAETYQGGLAVTAAATYSFSAYTNATGSGNVNIHFNWFDGSSFLSSSNSSTLIGPYGTERLVFTATAPATATNCEYVLHIDTAGVALFDAIQIEQKSYATPYLRNDSATATATRAAETMTVPTTGLSTSGGTAAGWFRFDNSTFGTSSSPPFRALDDNNDGYGFLAYGNTLSLKAGNGSVSYTLPGSLAVGKWVHLAVAWDGSNVYAYVYGSSVGTVTQGATALGATWDIGGLNGGQQVDGSISNLAFFNRALTPAEIYSLATSTQPLVDALATPISPAEQSLNSAVSSPDSNDNYTVATYRRRDNTIESVATLSGTPSPSGSSNYPTLTIQYYDATGTVVTETVTYALTYDANDKITSKVIQ